MKIAVSYEDGNIFQHFGHSKMFKIYEICLLYTSDAADE